MSTCRATQRRLSSAEARRATTLDWTEPVDLTFARRILAPALAATRPPAQWPRSGVPPPSRRSCCRHMRSNPGVGKISARGLFRRANITVPVQLSAGRRCCSMRVRAMSLARCAASRSPSAAAMMEPFIRMWHDRAKLSASRRPAVSARSRRIDHAGGVGGAARAWQSRSSVHIPKGPAAFQRVILVSHYRRPCGV